MAFGYETLQEDFQRLIDADNLSHAYLFYGEPETGKFLIASDIAQKISNPADIHIVDFRQEEDSAESVGIEKVRELEHFLFQTPSSQPEGKRGFRIVIIRDAQWLTVQAQNALLKILEEPPASGIIFATATDAGVFLPAVRSRFQLVFVPLLPESRVIDFLKQFDIIIDRKLEIAHDSRGRIGRAMSLLHESEPRMQKAGKLAHMVMHSETASEKKKISDEILEFFGEEQGNADRFIESLACMADPKKHTAFAHALNEFSYLLHTTSIQKRIHLKKLL